MASRIDLAALTDVFVKQINQVVVDACNNDNYLYNMLRKDKPQGSGGKSQWQVVTARPTAQGFVENGAFKAPDRFTNDTAELRPGYIHQVLELTGETADALKNSSFLQISDYMSRQFMAAMESLIAEIEAAIYGGAHSTSNFVGLASAIEDGNTYATIDRSTETMFRSYVNDNGGTPRALTKTLMLATYNGLRNTNRGRFTHILASPTQCDAWRALAADTTKLGGQVQVTGNVYNMVAGTGTQEFGNSGVWFQGIQWTEIPGYPTDRIDFIDLSPSNINLEVHREFQISDPERQSDNTVWDITVGMTMPLRNPRRTSARLGDLS